MYARLTFIDINPRDLKDMSSVYNAKIAPAVKAVKGNIDAMLLESADGSGQIISLTTWNDKADADQYESSGKYRELVDMLKDKFVGKPVLKTYNVQESAVSV